ncbi:MAG: NFACT RNA binding domain-containing protein, partial [Thermoprotei archaeon]
PPRGAPIHLSVELRGETLLQALVHAYNCPAELILEALFRVGVDPSLSPGAVGGDTLDGIRGVCAELIEGVRGGKLEPNLVFSDGVVVDVHPIVFKHQGLRFEVRPSFSAAVAEYYEPALKRFLSEEAVGELDSKAKRLLASAAKSRQTAREASDRAERLRKLAELLFGNPSIFELALKAARRNSANEASSIVAPLGLGVGEVNGISLILSYEGASFKFDPRRSVYDNLGSLYEEAKSLERKSVEALRAAEELEKQAEGLSREVNIQKKRAIRLSVAHRKWFEKYRWFYTSASKLVIAGRDAQQNQSIVRKYARKGYTSLHADIQGAPLTLLMADADEQSLLEAAQFAASYSKAWNAGLSSVDVFYTDASNVSLQAPSGEYLPKGGVMFYEKNYVRGVSLGLSVGFMNIDEGEFRLNAWPSAANVGRVCARIAPGEEDRDSIAKKLLKILRQVGGEYGEYALTLRVDEILPLIPGPSKLV